MSKFGSIRVYCDADLKECPKEEAVYKFKSKLEYKCARRLENERWAGEIVSWEYEKEKFLLKDSQGRTKTYVPDFSAYKSGWRYIEVKGYLRDGDRKKLSLAGGCTIYGNPSKHPPQLPYPLYVYSAKWEMLPVAEYLKRKRNPKRKRSNRVPKTG
jgi:hypothetical protein